MNLLECNRNAELKRVLAAGHWPQAAPGELREHVQACWSCADTVAISIALKAEKAGALRERPTLSPNLIWWRAQLRQRQTKMEKISKPILRAQVVTLFIAIVVCAGLMWEALRVTNVSNEAQALGTDISTFVGSLGTVTSVVGLAMLGLMGSALVYAVLGRE